MNSSETASSVVTNKEGGGMRQLADQTVVCAGCRRPIRDQYMLHIDPGLDWHASCLRCVECSQPLDESRTCFVRHGRAYCKPDYTRLFAVKCSRCGLGFDKINLVMRARERIYHIDCFRCVTCQRQLVSGDEFALRGIDAGLVCREHYDLVDADLTSEGPPTSSTGDMLYSTASDSVLDALCVDTDAASTSLSSPTTTVFAAKHATTGANSDTDVNSKLSHTGNCSPQTSSANVGGGKKQASGGSGNGTTRHATRGGKSDSQTQHGSGGATAATKTTRIRTVLNEKQLHTLRTCYAANPRPDALMKDQLVEMTGLSSRVIRVWFQNKRCKDKKRTILIKQLQQQHQEKVHGVPMIASSPIRMQDQNPALLQASTVQIHHQYVQHGALSPDSSAAPGLQPDSAVPPAALSIAWPAGSGGPSCLPPPAVPVDYGGLAATSNSVLVGAGGGSDVDMAPTTAAFQQLLESFGFQSDLNDDVDDDDTVVNLDEKTSSVLARNSIKSTRSLSKQQQQQSRLPPIVQSHHHAVCSAARC